MPTVRGWGALGAAAALGILFVGFGEQMLLAVGAFFVAAVGYGVLYVRSAVPRVRIERKLVPVQVHDGDRAIVDLSLTSQRKIHQVAVEDEVAGLGSAHFVADRVEVDDPVIARYEVLCKPRGVYRVGPALVKVTDLLGMAESGGPAGTADRLVVYPTVEELEGLPVVRGQDPNLNTAKANFSHTGGEDFYTLREYQQGDDLRRVHWPASARHDRLMIRQLEMPWQSRALVLLDPRTTSYKTAESFEQAVRGAASATRHLFRNGFSPTLWTGTAGGGTPVNSAESYSIAMESLATVKPLAHIDLRSLIARMRRSGVSGGALVMVTGPPDGADVAVYRVLSRDFRRTIVMAVAQTRNEAILQFSRAGVVTVLAGPTEKWAPVWREAMERTWSTATAG